MKKLSVLMLVAALAVFPLVSLQAFATTYGTGTLNNNGCSGHPQSWSFTVQVPTPPTSSISLIWSFPSTISVGIYPLCTGNNYQGANGVLHDVTTGVNICIPYNTPPCPTTSIGGSSSSTYVSFGLYTGLTKTPYTISYGDQVYFTMTVTYPFYTATFSSPTFTAT